MWLNRTSIACVLCPWVLSATVCCQFRNIRDGNRLVSTCVLKNYATGGLDPEEILSYPLEAMSSYIMCLAPWVCVYFFFSYITIPQRADWREYGVMNDGKLIVCCKVLNYWPQRSCGKRFWGLRANVPSSQYDSLLLFVSWCVYLGGQTFKRQQPE